MLFCWPSSKPPTTKCRHFVPKNIEKILETYTPKDEEKEEGFTHLLTAIKQKAPAEDILALIASNPEDCKVSVHGGTTPLHMAMEFRSEAKSIKVIQALLEEYPEAAQQCTERHQRTPLHLGLRDEAPAECLLAVLNAYPKACEMKDDNGSLPIHASFAWRTPFEVTKALLAIYPKGAEILTREGSTALHYGMQFQAPIESIRAILDVYPQATEIKLRRGYTPLQIGCKHGASIEAIRVLLENNPKSAQLPDFDGLTTLHMTIKSTYGTEDCILAILEHCPEAARIQNNQSRPSLHFAIKHGSSLVVVRALLEAYPEATLVKDIKKWTPLHIAMDVESPLEIVKALLEANPDAAKVVDKEENYPLHLGMKKGTIVEVIQAVLNAHPLAAKRQGLELWTPLHCGMSKNVPVGAVRAVLDANPEAAQVADNTLSYPLHAGLFHNADPEKIRLVLNAWPEAVRRSNFKGHTPLHDAVGFASVESVGIVLEAFPRAARLKDRLGNTPLFSFLQRVHRPGRSKLSQTDPKAPQESPKGSGRPVQETTDLVESLFRAYPEAAEVVCESGGSPISILVSEIANHSHSLDRILKNDTGLRLKILMQGIRDGRGLQTMCSVENTVSLQIFFALFDKKESLSKRCKEAIPAINLNENVIHEWTLLEILADFDTTDSSTILLQIVTEQRSKMEGTQMRRIRVYVDNKDDSVEFDSIDDLTEATMTKVADRARLANSSAVLRKWGQEYGRFLGKYRIEKGEDPKHVSDTCVVIFGTEIMEEEGHLRESRVALKFMSHKEAFKKEVEKRRNIDPKFVVPIKECYIVPDREDIDIDFSAVSELKCGIDLESEIREYEKIHLKSGSDDLKFLLVMGCGAGVDLHDVIGHQNIAGKDLGAVVSTAKDLAQCLRFLNEKCGVMHGDVKARNFVARGVGLGFATIDLDNAASIVDGEAAGQKRTSSGYLPPEQAAVELSLRSMDTKRSEPASPDDGEEQIVELKAKLKAALSSDDFKEVLRLSALLQKVQEELDNRGLVSPIVASAKYDMWCFGALLYYLCTGMQLFNVDINEEVRDDELRLLVGWSQELKSEKLAEVRTGWPKTLLEKLLEKYPNNRPTNWSEIIYDLETTMEEHKGGQDTHTSGRDEPVLFDRLVVFQAGPLAYVDRTSNSHFPIPLLDFEYEADALKQSLKDAEKIGAKIEIDFEIATTDRFSAFFAQGSSRVMHLSCHGHPEYLALETGFGDMQALPVDDLRRFVAAGGCNLKVVFVSACHSREAGNAFLKAGVPHVVCCRQAEKFRDEGAIEFARNFYRAMACKKTLKQSFQMARESMRVSPMVEEADIELDKYLLLPEKGDDDPYHDVSVFFTDVLSYRNQDLGTSVSCEPLLPRVPHDFIGREVDMYRILEALRRSDLVLVRGKPGSGRGSIMAATARYVWKRQKSFLFDDIIWLPFPVEAMLDQSSLYESLRQIVGLIMNAKSEVWRDETYKQCWGLALQQMRRQRMLFIIDSRCFVTGPACENFKHFKSDLLNLASVKIMAIGSTFENEIPATSRRTESVEVGPLDFRSSALLFARTSPYILRGHFPVARSAEELVSHTIPSPVGGSADRGQELFERIGSGLPSVVRDLATSMSEEDIAALLRLARRPALDVDSRNELERMIEDRLEQRKEACNAKNFLLVRDLEEIVEELVALRTAIPSLSELLRRKDELKTELEGTAATKNYESAAIVQKQLKELDERIEKERK